ncbi:MAG: ABC-F family ATP-binding cassette domain-containing protein [Phycisphaerales bacterium]|nr:ABC-F family ATP-binding cassette domain-containing protein [Phycisphaerae bacterium]NNF42557.1 ABC-F family ATP-binding cassette domain-containing protein [Phycisphaerales bacterium]NNM26455.1 ABC-F family ATP-binding cassette domain-containing protein [Phycisphaerales bacterium]
MSLLTVANITHQFGTHIVLDGATASFEAGEKVGLVGRNGSGKTTLMRVMLGQLAPDGGSMQLQRGARVGYLSQDPELDPDETLRDAAEGAFAELHGLHVKINEVYEAMATAGGDEVDRLLKQQARLEAAIEAAGGYAIDHRIDAMLHGLGFTDDQFGLLVRDLSGGQKGRLGLARLLLDAPDLLLLDEPTNHLDIEGRRWLEQFLAEEYPGAVIVVSHDRWLLDRVVTRIVEVERGVIREYPGNYHKYIELRRERQLTQARVHDKQLDKIRQEQQFIARYKTGQRAKQARGRQSRLDRFKRDELVDRPLETKVMRLQLPRASRSGEQVITAEGISKRYGDLVLFDDFSLSVARGDRIGIIGPNGIGKTTLVRVLLGDLEPDAGTVRIGSRMSVGYYRQLHDHIDRSLLVWQYLQSVIVSLDGQVKASEQQARDLAGAFLFSGEEQEKSLGEVSGGERSRAVLAGLVAGAHNLLILDEPTNHLDIPSAERLEQALSSDGGYDGTLLLISHDRALLEATCDRLIIFEGEGAVRVFSGRYTDWERRQETPPPTPEPVSAPPKPKPKNAKPSKRKSPPPPGGGKKKSGVRGLSIRDLETRIETLEQRLRVVDTEMLNPDVYTDGVAVKKLQAERAAVQAELTPLEEEWIRRAGDA